jgi:MoxR-like ATPase
MTAAQIIEYQKLVQRAQIAPHVQDYAVRVALATHPKGRESDGRYATPMVQKYVRVGASPRAAQALVLAAKCRALLDGRPAAGVEDIRAVALPALRHRIILNFEGEAEGVTTDTVVRNIVDTLPVQG